MKRTHKFTPLLLALLLALPAWAQKNEPKLKTRLQYSQAYLYAPQEVEVSWDAENTQSVEIVGIAQSLPAKGSYKLLFEENKSYRLLLKGKKQEKNYTLRMPFKKLEILQFKLQDTLLASQGRTQLLWQVKDATQIRLEINGKVQSDKLPPQGRMEIQMDTAAQHFRLLAEVPEQGLRTEATQSLLHKVDGYFRGNQSAFLVNEVLTLSWSFAGVDAVKLYKKVDNKVTLLAEQKGGQGSYRYGAVTENTPAFVLEVYQGEQLLLSRNYQVRLQSAKISISAKNASENKWQSSLLLNKNESFDLRWESSLFDSLYLVNTKGQKIATSSKAQGQLNGLQTSQDEHFTLWGYNKVNKRWEGKTIDISVRKRPYVKGQQNIGETAPDDEIVMEIIETDFSQYPKEVKLRVIAVNKKGDFVSGLADSPELQKKYFLQLSERFGKQSAAREFRVQEYKRQVSQPYHFSMALDYSGSMGGNDKSLEKALEGFLNIKSAQDLVSLTKFDDKIIRYVTAKSSKADTWGKFPKGFGQFGGGTALYAAADAALQALEAEPTAKVLILMTDGMENSSFALAGSYAFSAEQIVQKARAQGVRIYPVLFGRGTNAPLMQEIAALTGGYCYEADSPSALAEAYNEIPRVFQQYYEISYQPQSQKGRRSIELSYFNLQTKKQSKSEYQNEGPFEQLWMKEFQLSPTFAGGFQPIFSNKKPVTVPQNIALFKYNQADFEQQYRASLRPIIEYLQKKPEAVIEIYGHTDLVGDAYKQIDLSQRRADAVRDYLIAQGIAPERVATKGFGKEKPVWPLEKESWQAQENRRIEVLILE
jgi:outer membrane protein OmpA-like peptidoglycan-associated protein